MLNQVSVEHIEDKYTEKKGLYQTWVKKDENGKEVECGRGRCKRRGLERSKGRKQNKVIFVEIDKSGGRTL